jgi:hypothetical protein
MRARNGTHLEPALLTTEIHENVLTAENSVRALVNLTHAMREAVRYILSNDVERRVMVKPYTDPALPGETMWMTEAGPPGTRPIRLFWSCTAMTWSRLRQSMTVCHSSTALGAECSGIKAGVNYRFTPIAERGNIRETRKKNFWVKG